MVQGNRERVRVLYERLLDRTKHVKVWLSYAKFEAEPLPLPEQEQQDQQQQQSDQPQQQRQRQAGEGLSVGDRAARAARARAVFERGFRSIREGSPDAKEEAVMLLEAWRDFEAAGSEFRWVGLLFVSALAVILVLGGALCGAGGTHSVAFVMLQGLGRTLRSIWQQVQVGERCTCALSSVVLCALEYGVGSWR